MSLHDQVHAFADGELPPEEVARFRDHLAGCTQCQAELEEILQMQALSWKPPVAEAPVIPLAWWRKKRTLGIATSFLAMAAALALFFRVQGGEQLMVGATRHLEARLTRADVHRPYDVERGGPAHEKPSLKLLARLEEKGDWNGLATAWLLAGDANQAAAYLDKLGTSVDADNTRAVFYLVHGDYENAITWAERALAAKPKMTQALWNRALAERELGLIRMAAQSFGEVAQRNELGWSDEARLRKKALDDQAQAETARARAVEDSGKKMVAGGPPITLELARSNPGPARHYFYDALRSAQTQARVLELKPLAEELDRADHGDELVKAVTELAAANFAVRGPLAAAYSDLATGKGAGDEAGQKALIARFEQARQKDLVLGALHVTGLGASDPPAFQRLAESTQDRDLMGMGVYFAAGERAAKNDSLGTVTLLSRWLVGCEHGGVERRCANNQSLLTINLMALHRVAEARASALASWNRARRVGDPTLETQILAQLGEVHLLANRFALVRAYLGENALREPNDAGVQSHAHETMAVGFIAELKPESARAEIAGLAKAGRSLDLNGIWVLADLAHLGISNDERKLALDSLAKIRQMPGLTNADLALMDFLEGRLLIDLDPQHGDRLLHNAIKAADQLPRENADAQKARAFAYQTLIAAAAQADDYGRAFHLFAQEAGLSDPPSCVVAVGVDNEREISIVQGNDGVIRGTMASRTRPEVDSEHFVVGMGTLQGCGLVPVIARPPLFGSPDLLPPTYSWNYRVGYPKAAKPGPKRRVIVSDVQPPPALKLPKLAGWRSGSGPGVTELTGAAATPARVLAEIADATEIVFNAHGLVDPGQSDATLLALTPDAEGRYSLGIADLRDVKLKGAPFVILAACRAGELVVSSPHEPISLPTAFLRAGARAVLASSQPIPDADAARFFDALQERAGHGALLAVALHDERQAWLQKNPSSWVRDVMLFE